VLPVVKSIITQFTTGSIEAIEKDLTTDPGLILIVSIANDVDRYSTHSEA
jgi:hypothetical protein